MFLIIKCEIFALCRPSIFWKSINNPGRDETFIIHAVTVVWIKLHTVAITNLCFICNSSILGRKLSIFLSVQIFLSIYSHFYFLQNTNLHREIDFTDLQNYMCTDHLCYTDEENVSMSFCKDLHFEENQNVNENLKMTRKFERTKMLRVST